MCLPSGMEALSLFDAQLAPQIDLVPSVELTQASARPMASMAPMGSMAPMAQMAAPMPVGPALLAVDGNSLVHRAYHAYGETGAVYGFLALLAAICDLSGPDAVVVGFDCRDGNDRKRRCAYYKANRAEKDSGLVTALAEVPEVLTELGVHVVCVPGQEADDVLGSAAATAEADAWRCVLATSDRDAFGLISDRTSVLRLRNGLANARVVTGAALQADLGVRPQQYVEFAALRGDTSDNLPGVAGIGPSRAAALFAAFDRVDDAAADPIGCTSVLGLGPGRALLADLADPSTSVFRRNVDLMTIRRDLPLDIDDCALGGSLESLTAVLQRRRLPGLVSRLAVAFGARPADDDQVPLPQAPPL